MAYETISRRTFLNGLAAGAAGTAMASTARSYGQILGANDRVNFAVNGLNGRGYAHLDALKNNDKNARISLYLRSRLEDPCQIRRQSAAGTWLRAQGGAGFSQRAGFKRCGCDHRCHARSLAHADGGSRSQGRQTCVRRKAFKPESARGRAALLPRKRNTASMCRWATSSVRPTTRSR